MKKFYLALPLLFCLGSLMAQPLRLYPNGIPLFLHSNGDTLNSPFTGGLTCPQLQSMDVNGDGRADLLVLDRQGSKLLTYLETCKGQYVHRPEYEHLFPQLQTWFQVVDYNRDGLPDIWAGNYSNVDVYKNTGSKLKPQFVRVAETLWTVHDGVFQEFNVYSDAMNTPSVIDMDNDGDIDMASLNILGGYIDYYQNLQVEQNLPKDSIALHLADFCWGALEIAMNNDAILGRVCMKNYRHSSRHFNSSFLHLDLDGDGDKDMLHGDISFDHLISMKNGRKEYSWAWDTVVSTDTIFPRNTSPASVMRFPAAFYFDYDKDSVKDLLVAPQDVMSSKNQNQVLFYKNHRNDSLPDFRFTSNTELQHHTVDLGSQSSPALLDADADGDLDLLVASGGDMSKTGDSAYSLYVYKNTGTAQQPVYQLSDTNFLGMAADKLRWLMPATGDVDGDGKTDLLLGSNTGQLMWYQAVGAGFSKQTDYLDSLDLGSYAAPCLARIDADTLPDLLVGLRNGTISYYRNTGGTKPRFEWMADTIGMINVADTFFDGVSYVKASEGYAAPAVADFNADGLPDIAVGAYNGTVRVFSNILNNLKSYCPEVDSVLHNYGTNTGTMPDLGTLSRPVAGFFDGDTLPDLMLGTGRGGLQFFGSVNHMPDSATLCDSLPIAINLPLQVTDYSFFPNPAGLQFNLLRSGNSTAATFSLFDMFGKTMLSQPLAAGQASCTLHIGHLPAAVYVYAVTEAGGRIVKGKLVKY